MHFIYKFSKNKKAIYVGFTQCITKRLEMHCCNSVWFGEWDTLTFSAADASYYETVLEETRLIELHQPRYNLAGNPKPVYLKSTIAKDNPFSIDLDLYTYTVEMLSETGIVINQSYYRTRLEWEWVCDWLKNLKHSIIRIRRFPKPQFEYVIDMLNEARISYGVINGNLTKNDGSRVIGKNFSKHNTSKSMPKPIKKSKRITIRICCNCGKEYETARNYEYCTKDCEIEYFETVTAL